MFQTLGKFFYEGGIFMYPITFLLAFGIAVAIERFVVLFRRYNLDAAKYYNFVEQKVRNKELTKITNTSPDIPLSNIIKFGIQMVQNLEKETVSNERTLKGERRVAVMIEKTIEEVAAHEFPKVERRLTMLPTVANLATLLGLLGTLQGLIQSFSSLSNIADPAMKAQLLAKGISTAMNTTAYGLFAAVLILFCYAILNARAERIMEETEYYVLKFINLITLRY